MIGNAPARNNKGIDKESQPSATTVTGSLLQKPVTLAAANLGSCDKNPGKADTTINTGAIFGKRRPSSKMFNPRVDGAKSSWGGIRPAAGKHSKNLKNEKYLENLKISARQGSFISDKTCDGTHPIGAVYGDPGGSKVLEGMSNKDNCGGAGTK
jgi:hypothetical protein